MQIKAAYTWEMYRRLKSVGCSVQPPKSAGNASKLEMQQAGLCLIEEIRSGVAFIFDLDLRAFSPCRVDFFELNLPGWSPELFRWVGPEELRLLKEFPEYSADLILNRVAEKHTELKKGALLDGVLVGFAPGKIPKHCTTPILATLSVYDTLRNCTSLDFETVLSRRQVSQHPAKRREGLFAGKIDLEHTDQPAVWNAESPRREERFRPGRSVSTSLRQVAA